MLLNVDKWTGDQSKMLIFILWLFQALPNHWKMMLIWKVPKNIIILLVKHFMALLLLAELLGWHGMINSIPKVQETFRMLTVRFLCGNKLSVLMEWNSHMTQGTERRRLHTWKERKTSNEVHLIQTRDEGQWTEMQPHERRADVKSKVVKCRQQWSNEKATLKKLWGLSSGEN